MIWFLFVVVSGVHGTPIPMQAGPFATLKECQRASEWYHQAGYYKARACFGTPKP